MSTHSFFSPSKSAMFVACHGAMAQPQNQAPEAPGPKKFADDGTATHMLGGWALQEGKDCEHWLGQRININGLLYDLDEARVERAQGYVDDVRRRALGGHLFIEQRIDISEWLGEGQGGTGDAAIYQPREKLLIVEDLKDGQGDKVYASYFVGREDYFDENGDPAVRDVYEINPQLGCYALGLLKDFQLFGAIERVLVVIYQRGHIDEFEISVPDLLKFGERVKHAIAEAGKAMLLPEGSPDLELYLNPGDKQCRWCRAKTNCTKYEKMIVDETRSDFDDPTSELLLPVGSERLSRAFRMLPLIQQWCKAVTSEVYARVATGGEIIGPDGLPLKFVEGEEGKRQWIDAKVAEEMLLGQLGPEKTYEPRKVITAPAAGKLLDRKATKALWKEVFGPLIQRKPGAPQLTTGSDSRPPYTRAAGAEEFEDADISE